MYKLKTLKYIEDFITNNPDSLIRENSIEFEYITNTRILIRCNRISDVENDLFLIVKKLALSTETEDALLLSTLISSIRFCQISNGILIYIADE